MKEEDYERIIVIGDLHGHYRQLSLLLEKINVGENDLIIFIGDYIDRGPDSKLLVGKLIQLNQVHKNIIFLKGNHEDMLLGSIGFPAVVNDLDTWLYNGGTSTLASYGIKGSDMHRLLRIRDENERAAEIRNNIPESNLKFFLALELYFETEHFFFCHAGVNPYSTIEEGKKNVFDLLWMRDHLYAVQTAWEKKVVCGHTPLSDVLITDNLICVDTGLFYYGKLSAVDVLSNNIIQVDR